MFYTAAAEPDQDGWTLFRDHLWRGEVADEGHMRVLVEDALGVPVERVEFRALETDQDYVDALREAIADDLEAFRAETVDEVLSKYIGSAIEVRDAEAF